MLWQLVKFKIRTTFRKSVIVSVILVFFILFFELPSFLKFFFSDPTGSGIVEYVDEGIIYISFYFLISSLFPSLVIQKPDLDFLFMLPFEERDVVIAQLISSFLLSLFVSIFIAYLLFPVLSFISILVVPMVSIINTFSYFVFRKHRKVASIIITVWMLSSILKFPFSPFSMIFGYVYGYFILATLDVVVLVLGLMNANIQDLINDFYKTQGISMQENKQTSSVPLYSSSSFAAMLKRSLSFVELGGRANVGLIRQVNKRVELHKMFIITSMIALIYYLSFTLIVKYHVQFLEKFTAGFVDFYIIGIIASTVFINEPLWLNLSAMAPIDYAKKYILAKTLTVFIILLPISVSIMILNPVAGSGNLLVPFTVIYISSIYARFYPVSQTQVSQFSLRNAVAGYLASMSLVPIYLDIFLPPLGIFITMVFVLPFLLSKGYWEKTFELMISNSSS